MHENANNGQQQKRKLAGSQEGCAVVEADDGLVLLQFKLGCGRYLVALLERRVLAGDLDGHQVRKTGEVFLDFNLLGVATEVDQNDDALFFDVRQFTKIVKNVFDGIAKKFLFSPFKGESIFTKRFDLKLVTISDRFVLAKFHQRAVNLEVAVWFSQLRCNIHIYVVRGDWNPRRWVF